MGRDETWRTKPALWRKLATAARGMRHAPTEAEQRLWERLKGEQLHAVRFRRQHALDRFIVDFYAPAYRLAIEVDGAIHAQQGVEDATRDAHLVQLGIAVIRVRNADVLDNLEAVLQAIADKLVARRKASTVRT